MNLRFAAFSQPDLLRQEFKSTQKEELKKQNVGPLIWVYVLQYIGAVWHIYILHQEIIWVIFQANTLASESVAHLTIQCKEE